MEWMLNRGLNGGPKGPVWKNLEVRGAELDLMHELLLLNRRMLDPDFVKKSENPLRKGIRISVVAPIEAQQPRTEACAHCGKVPRQMKRCAVCQTVGYCDKDCQTAHWKNGHKRVCKKPGETSSQGSGRIEAQSAPGAGTTFRLTLPST